MRSCAMLAAVVAVCMALVCVTSATPVAGAVAAVNPPFPSIPDAYSAVVSVNYAALNFTLAWSESWSDHRHRQL